MWDGRQVIISNQTPHRDEHTDAKTHEVSGLKIAPGDRETEREQRQIRIQTKG